MPSVVEHSTSECSSGAAKARSDLEIQECPRSETTIRIAPETCYNVQNLIAKRHVTG